MATAEERAKRRRRGLLAGARARAVGERAAVELAMDGALLASPRACAPASRRRASERPVPRPDEAGCVGLSRTMAAGCGTVQVSTHRPLL